MATIASLDIALGANSANLKRDLDKASTATKKFSSKAKGHAAAVTSAFKALAVGVAAITAAMGASALLSNADALIKNANGAGIAFEAYQRLAFGLEQAGLSQDSLQKGMKKLNTIMATAGDGTKSAVEDLAALGLTFEQLQGMSPEERFRAVVDGLNGIQDEGTRSAIAMKVLGKEFADRKFSSENLDAASSGLVTITTAAAMAAEGFNDSINLMQTNMSNMATNMIATVVPYVQIAVDTFNQFSANHPTMTGILTGLAAAGAAIIGLGVALTVVGAPFLAIAAAIAAAIAGIVFAVNNWDTVVRGFTEFLASTFNVSVEQAAGWITSVSSALQVAGEWAVTVGSWFATALLGGINLVISAIGTAITVFANLAGAVLALFTMDLNSFSVRMQNAFSAARDFFVENFGAAVQTIADTVKSQFSWAMEAAAVIFSNAVDAGINFVLKKMEAFLNKLVDAANFFGAGIEPFVLGTGRGPQAIPQRPAIFGGPGATTGTGLIDAIMPPVGMTTGTGLTSPIMPPSNVTPTTPTKPSGKGGGGGAGAKDKETPEEKLAREAAEEAEKNAQAFYDSFSGNFSTSLSSLLKGETDGGDFMTSILDQFTGSVVDKFSKGLTDGLLGEDGLDINGIFDKLDFEDMGKTLSSGIESIFSGLKGAGGGGGIGGFLGGIGSFIGTIFGFADGGIVPTTSTSSSYKDSVPAMLQPGELVVPVDEVGNFVGNSRAKGSTVNINVTGDISKQTRREIMEMIPQITQGVNSANKETNYDYR